MKSSDVSRSLPRCSLALAARYLRWMLGFAPQAGASITVLWPGPWSPVGPTRNLTQEKERPPKFLGNPCTRVPRSTTPMGVARPCLERTDYCGLPRNLPRRPPPHAPLRGSITRPTCVLSTLHDEGHPIAMQDSLPACWLGVDWAGLAPAGFQPRISRGSSATSFPIEPGFPGAQIYYARLYLLC
jgi:hypothetical protein